MAEFQMSKKARSARACIVCLLSLLSLLSWPMPTWGQVAGPEIYQALATSPKVRVVIALRQPTASPTDLPAMMAEIATIQRSVLSKLSAEDFTLTHQWEAVSGLAGEVSASGLAKLLADPDVVRVALDLEGSVQLLQAVSIHTSLFGSADFRKRAQPQGGTAESCFDPLDHSGGILLGPRKDDYLRPKQT